MKVWITVMDGVNETNEVTILGVYATREAAQAACDACTNYPDVGADDVVCSYSVREHDVQGIDQVTASA